MSKWVKKDLDIVHEYLTENDMDTEMLIEKSENYNKVLIRLMERFPDIYYSMGVI